MKAEKYPTKKKIIYRFKKGKWRKVFIQYEYAICDILLKDTDVKHKIWRNSIPRRHWQISWSSESGTSSSVFPSPTSRVNGARTPLGFAPSELVALNVQASSFTPLLHHSLPWCLQSDVMWCEVLASLRLTT